MLIVCNCYQNLCFFCCCFSNSCSLFSFLVSILGFHNCSFFVFFLSFFASICNFFQNSFLPPLRAIHSSISCLQIFFLLKTAFYFCHTSFGSLSTLSPELLLLALPANFPSDQSYFLTTHRSTDLFLSSSFSFTLLWTFHPTFHLLLSLLINSKKNKKQIKSLWTLWDRTAFLVLNYHYFMWPVIECLGPDVTVL